MLRGDDMVFMVNDIFHAKVAQLKLVFIILNDMYKCRFHILRGNEFKLAHVGTPWFRKLVRQQAEMLRQQQVASSPKPTGRRNRK